ncbi:DUF4238 domain-containing protein [Frateuria aurantia]
MYKKKHHPHEAPLVVPGADGKKVRNPNQITVNQHVIPQAHLKEWSRDNGLLNVFDKKEKVWLTPAPHDAFTVQRLWDQWTETTFLGINEGNYQEQVDLIKASLPIKNHGHISAYFLMLCIRSWVASKERPNYHSVMEFSSPFSTQSELEDIELKNVGSSVHMSHLGGRDSQSFARELVKCAMNMRFMQEVQRFSGVVWSPVDMGRDDAVLPDSLERLYADKLAILPVTPKIVLVGTSQGHGFRGDLELNSSIINEKLIGSSARYYVSKIQTFS